MISSLAGSIRGGSALVTVNRDTRVPSDKALAVLGEIGVKGQPIDGLHLLCI
jgi:hypothetical protein